MNAVLDRARTHALDQGIGINQADIQAILELPEQEVAQALDLAHQVRLRWCGDMVEVEGIISLKTGGCPRIVIFVPSRDCLSRRCGRCAWISMSWLRPPTHREDGGDGVLHCRRGQGPQ